MGRGAARVRTAGLGRNPTLVTPIRRRVGLQLSHEGFELRSPVTLWLSFVDVRSCSQMQEMANNKGIRDISACAWTRCRRLGVKGSHVQVLPGECAGTLTTAMGGKAVCIRWFGRKLGTSRRRAWTSWPQTARDDPVLCWLLSDPDSGHRPGHRVFLREVASLPAVSRC